MVAEEQFRLVLRLEADYPGAHMKLGAILLRGGQTRHAVKHLLAELKGCGENRETLQELGQLLIEARDTQRANHVLQRLVKLSPDDAHAHHNLAVSYFMMKKMDEGIQHCRRAIQPPARVSAGSVQPGPGAHPEGPTAAGAMLRAKGAGHCAAGWPDPPSVQAPGTQRLLGRRQKPHRAGGPLTSMFFNFYPCGQNRPAICLKSVIAGSDVDVQESVLPVERPQVKLLGVGLDCQDEQVRITRGKEFHLVGGSHETHQVMQEKCIKFSEKLESQGKRMSDLEHKEFLDMAAACKMNVVSVSVRRDSSR